MFVILYTLTNNITSDHHFLFTAATQSNTRQSFATKSTVLSANGRQRALHRTLVSRPRGAMFGHKVDESDVLRLQSVRIEVVAAPLGVYVHGDPVFSRSIGVVGVAHDRGRVRVDDDVQQRVFGNDVVRAAHQRVAR